MNKTKFDAMMAQVQWVPVVPDPEIFPATESDLPHATHEGTFQIAGFSFRCYQLSDGRRVFNADDLMQFLDPLSAE